MIHLLVHLLCPEIGVVYVYLRCFVCTLEAGFGEGTASSITFASCIFMHNCFCSACKNGINVLRDEIIGLLVTRSILIFLKDVVCTILEQSEVVNCTKNCLAWAGTRKPSWWEQVLTSLPLPWSWHPCPHQCFQCPGEQLDQAPFSLKTCGTSAFRMSFAWAVGRSWRSLFGQFDDTWPVPEGRFEGSSHYQK